MVDYFSAYYSWNMALNTDRNATFNNILNRKEMQEKAGEVHSTKASVSLPVTYLMEVTLVL
jgi:hypothetical protein